MTPKAPSITIETVTPHMAATLLGTMAGNRPLRQKVVQRYAREMVLGKWLLNGEAIKVDRRGKLIDGQHRLNAILMAKKDIPMCVVRGVDETAMITLDTGLGRSFHDTATIAEKDYSRQVGPIARLWLLYLSSTIQSRIAPTHQEIQQTIDEHPAIVESALFVGRHKTLTRMCVPSVQGFVHAYGCERYDRDMADAFMEDLNSGASLASDSPIYRLRERLVFVEGKARLDQLHVLALTIKAWNAWMAGERMTAGLRWRVSGPTPEPFPRFAVDIPAKPKRARKAD